MVGAKIRYFRQMKGITQEQLAAGLCSIPYLSKIEHGLAQPSADLLEHLCKELGVTLDQVDNEERIEALSHKLLEWYSEMRIRDVEQAKNKMETLEKEFKSVENPELLTTYLLFKFRYFILIQELDKANTLLERIYVVQESLTPSLEYYYHYFLGLYYYQLKKYNEALDSYLKAEKLSKEMNQDNAEKAEFYYQKALVHGRLHQVTSSNSYAFKALSIFNKEYNFKRSAETEVLLGINFFRILNYDDAIVHFKHALKYAESFNDRRLKSTIFHNLGFVNSSQNKPDEALKHFKLSLQNITDTEVEEYSQTIYMIAKEYGQQDAYEKAQKWLKEGLRFATEKEVLDYIFHLKIYKHQLENNINDEFEELLKTEAIPYFSQKQMWSFVTNYGEVLADYYNDLSKHKNASYYYRLANDARKKLLN
ncbi:helix-turn-helix transcriptional regulator [Pseudalkalibacillus caeni]|uniref:Tetratricopeptide repeat protein n=1 Tax=Exobacillus caeni TaxID=2574798 RepID=A0A5R9FC76_9BACL|nr:helix-turn-helix transcriptional regulator [Pseudalkalibacillus caeni]TLS38483.1 tetratricopeptide repeat protein [Pseudalkalibacillus caeni]